MTDDEIRAAREKCADCGGRLQEMKPLRSKLRGIRRI